MRKASYLRDGKKVDDVIFHQFEVEDYTDDFDNNEGFIVVAIIEFKNGKITTVPLRRIQFDSTKIEASDTLIKDFKYGVSKGERNKIGLRIAGLLESKTIDKELALIILSGWNTLNDPPLLTIEIENIIQLAY